MTPACPRCECRDCVPCDALQEASGESFTASHECQRCHQRFKFTPPTRSAERQTAA